jgi:hypothetical protein
MERRKKKRDWKGEGGRRGWLSVKRGRGAAKERPDCNVARLLVGQDIMARGSGERREGRRKGRKATRLKKRKKKKRIRRNKQHCRVTLRKLPSHTRRPSSVAEPTSLSLPVPRPNLLSAPHNPRLIHHPTNPTAFPSAAPHPPHSAPHPPHSASHSPAPAPHSRPFSHPHGAFSQPRAPFSHPHGPCSHLCAHSPHSAPRSPHSAPYSPPSLLWVPMMSDQPWGQRVCPFALTGASVYL